MIALNRRKEFSVARVCKITALIWLAAHQTTVQAKFQSNIVRPKSYRDHQIRLHWGNNAADDSPRLFQHQLTIANNHDEFDEQQHPGVSIPVGSSTWSERDGRLPVHRALSASGGSSVVADLHEVLDEQPQQHQPTVTVVPAALAATNAATPNVQTLVKAKAILAEKMKRFIALATPIVLAVCGIRHRNASTTHLMSLGSIYVWSLIGSSVGFYIFLYFISVGYALGIGLPILVTFGAYLRYSQHPLSIDTILHATLVLLWSVRLMTFLLYREHISWPALHAKVVRVKREQRVGIVAKVLCWLCYSFLYVCMLLPCWLRMEEGSHQSMRKLGSRFGIGLQTVGLFVEAVADYQKNRFKSSHRLAWCREGLWNYSTHPNYAGEWLFWLGTYIAGGTSRNATERVLQMVGFGFISIVLHGATKMLAKKQTIKYGEAYRDFRSKHTIFGPKLLRQRQNHSMVESDVAVVETEQSRHDGNHSWDTNVLTNSSTRQHRSGFFPEGSDSDSLPTINPYLS